MSSRFHRSDRWALTPVVCLGLVVACWLGSAGFGHAQTSTPRTYPKWVKTAEEKKTFDDLYNQANFDPLPSRRVAGAYYLAELAYKKAKELGQSDVAGEKELVGLTVVSGETYADVGLKYHEEVVKQKKQDKAFAKLVTKLETGLKDMQKNLKKLEPTIKPTNNKEVDELSKQLLQLERKFLEEVVKSEDREHHLQRQLQRQFDVFKESTGLGISDLGTSLADINKAMLNLTVEVNDLRRHLGDKQLALQREFNTLKQQVAAKLQAPPIDGKSPPKQLEGSKIPPTTFPPPLCPPLLNSCECLPLGSTSPPITLGSYPLAGSTMTAPIILGSCPLPSTTYQSGFPAPIYRPYGGMGPCECAPLGSTISPPITLGSYPLSGSTVAPPITLGSYPLPSTTYKSGFSPPIYQPNYK